MSSFQLIRLGQKEEFEKYMSIGGYRRNLNIELGCSENLRGGGSMFLKQKSSCRVGKMLFFKKLEEFWANSSVLSSRPVPPFC